MPKSSKQTDAEIEQNEAEASDGIHVDTEQNKGIQIIEDDDNDNLNEENEIETDLSEKTETVENAQSESTENKTRKCTR
jgi:predicted P-loop ATPase